MRWVLVTGGSHSEIPLIKAAQAMGYKVLSTGFNDEGLGHKVSDCYIKGDFSDCNFVYELAKKYCVEGIISGCNDFAYLSTAYACEKLGLAGHDTYEIAKIIHEKEKFREMVGSLGIRSPRIEKCFTAEDALNKSLSIGFPVMIKPTDLTGGKGVKRCDSYEEVEEAFEEAIAITRKNFVIVEQLIEGQSHGFTSLIKTGKVVWHMIDDEQYGQNKYMVLGASVPSDIPMYAEYSLINDIEKLAKHCKLADGLFHVQFILDNEGYPVMIDPCRRAPGDLYVLLVKYSTGIDYPFEIVSAELGNEVMDSYAMHYKFVARECIMSDKPGKISDICIDDLVNEKNVYEMMWWKKGDIIKDYLKYKAGIVIMEFSSSQEMNEALANWKELVKIEIQ